MWRQRSMVRRRAHLAAHAKPGVEQVEKWAGSRVFAERAGLRPTPRAGLFIRPDSDRQNKSRGGTWDTRRPPPSEPVREREEDAATPAISDLIAPSAFAVTLAVSTAACGGGRRWWRRRWIAAAGPAAPSATRGRDDRTGSLAVLAASAIQRHRWRCLDAAFKRLHDVAEHAIWISRQPNRRRLADVAQSQQDHHRRHLFLAADGRLHDLEPVADWDRSDAQAHGVGAVGILRRLARRSMAFIRLT